MTDQKKREIFIQAYKIFEQFERPTADAEYWQQLADAMEAMCRKFDGIYMVYAQKIGNAIFDALEAELKAAQQEAKA